ncbi:MAG: hypothetical protein R3E79_27340 [Caldilineaceae bacterium]
MTAKATRVFKGFRLLLLTFIVGRSLYSCVFVPVIPPPALLTPVTLPVDYETPSAVVADHLRVVTLDAALLRESQFSLTFFDATTHIALLDRVEEQAKGHFTWIGHLAGDHGSLVQVAVQGQIVSGTIQVNGARYELQPLYDNLYTFYERSMTT